METKSLLRGMATISYWADDVKKARTWYTELFGMEPYFQKPDAENPSYIEYRIGDYQHEVGIVDKNYMPKTAAKGTGGATLYWHVDNVQYALDRLLSKGATAYEPVTERGKGFVTAAVIDPFGNIVGIMQNPHYLEVLGNQNH